MPAPARIKAALIPGATRSLSCVCTPMLRSPALMPWRSERGMGTKREAIPKISTTSPTADKALMRRPPNCDCSSRSDPGVMAHELPLRCSQKLDQILPELLTREVFGELHQTAHRNSRRTFRNPRLVVFHPGGAGDIEMQPGRVFGELFEEHGGGDGPAISSAGIHHVGNVGADLLFVFIIERQAPHFLARLGQGFVEALVHLVI